MKPTLLILAAGMASRYGSLKQIDSFGLHGEAIIDYSIYDALRAGFGKIVFVIRKSFEKEFKEIFNHTKFGLKESDVCYTFQELDFLPDGFTIPEGREKPWGTNHALLTAMDIIKEPFAVINADDFYGKEAFQSMAKFLSGLDNTTFNYAMIGYKLKNTISENGSVSRGVCDVKDGLLTKIIERTNIITDGGKIFFEENDKREELDRESYVSMNFFGFTPDYFKFSMERFKDFYDNMGGNLKAEYFIPLAVQWAMDQKQAKLNVIDCNSVWFGVTYKEDKETVKEALLKLIKDGAYPDKLWK